MPREARLRENKDGTYECVTRRALRPINGVTNMTDKTKTELAAIIGGMTASQIKKASHADLVERAAHTEAEPQAAHVLDLPAITAAEHHLLIAFAHCENTPLNGAPKQAEHPSDLSTWVWLDTRKVGDMTTAQKKGVLASLVKKGFVTVTPDSEGDLIRWTDAGFAVLKAILGQPMPALTKPKAADKPATAKDAPARPKAPKAPPPARRKLNADGILFAPADRQKEPKEGSKRALLLALLRGLEGTTVDDMAAATGWGRGVASSALYVDVKGAGYGVERINGRLHLLPRGAK